MYVKYDALNRHESLVLTLCNPGSIYADDAPTKVVGMLADVSDEEMVVNFNSLSELNFRTYKVWRDDAEADAYTHAMYKAVQPRRLLFVTGIGYFVISNVEEGMSEDGSCYKDVSAKSIESEIQNRKVPYIANGTYRFANDDANNITGILETLVATLPLWTIGEVDDAVASKYRTFEDVSTELNVLSFMIDNMQDAYECIFLFNIINRTINVYDQANYVRQTSIHITRDDVIKHLDISENADNLYTAISVMGDENITIAAINPLGGNVIYNFEYYYDWMSPGLGEKVSQWQAAIDAQKTPYYDLGVQYYTKLEEASNFNMEMQRITTQMTMYRRCRENIVAESSTDLVDSYNNVIVENGGEAITIYDEIADTIACIDALLDDCQAAYDAASASLDIANGELETLKSQIDAIRKALVFENYFTDAEYEELCNYVFEGSYTDDYVIITDIMSYPEKFAQMKVLFDRAETTLQKASSPTQEFNIDSENFIFVKEFEQWSEELETGCLINVELDVDDVALLFLSNITVNYDDHTLRMTFGNRFTKFDTQSLYDDVLGNISKSANTLNYIKEILYPIKNGELNAMREALDTTRNLTMNEALSSSDEEVVIDGSGYTGKKKLNNGTYDPRQVKITGKSIVFTDDAWQSCKVAIGETILGDGETAYGVNAQTVIGDIIMGNSLRILDNSGNDILTVVDGKIESSVGEVNDALTQIRQDAEGLSIRVQTLEDNDGEVTEVTTTTGYTFNADGLTIYKSGEEIKNLLNNTGMYVSRSDDNILVADADGVNAINLTARQYLTIGAHSRFEDYGTASDSSRTACFFIGDE